MNRRDWGIVAAVGALGLGLSWAGIRRRPRDTGNRRQRNERREREAEEVTAVAMAREAGISPNVFRAALRAAELPWHDTSGPWKAVRDSREHKDMIRVLEELLEQRRG